jgi:putative Mg2+ transporter-C (MgtC) family protein
MHASLFFVKLFYPINKHHMISNSEIILRIVLSAIFGAIIGIERERKNWSAGMRTHMMVCVGATLIMIVSAFGFEDILSTSSKTMLDPSRIAAQVISGIGFIGAGTILFLKQGVIRGLTTASGLWTVAAIGLATGGGMYFAAAITTFTCIMILWGMQPIERLLAKRFKQKNLQLTIHGTPNNSGVINDLFHNQKVDTSFFTFDKRKNESLIQIRFNKIHQKEVLAIIKDLETDAQIKEIHWNS